MGTLKHLFSGYEEDDGRGRGIPVERKVFIAGQDDLGEYDLEHFYTRTTNKADHSRQATVRYSPYYEGLVHEAIDDPLTEWKSVADLFRDALAHRLVWWHAHQDRPMTPQMKDMLAGMEEERISFANDTKAKLIKQYEEGMAGAKTDGNVELLRDYVQRVWDHAELRLDDQWFSGRLEALANRYATECGMTREG